MAKVFTSVWKKASVTSLVCHLTSAIKRIFEHTQHNHCQKNTSSRNSRSRRWARKPRREIKDRVSEQELRFARPESLSYPRNQRRGRKSRRLRTIVLNNGENYADCGTPRNTERGMEKRRGGSRQGGLSRMETSQSKTIGNHPGTTCANYFTKQSLSWQSPPLLQESFDRYDTGLIGSLQRRGTMPPIQTSVSDIATH